MAEEKEFKPEPPKPLKETAVLRYKLDIIRSNIKTILDQIDDMEKSIDDVEEHYKKILEHPVPIETTPASASKDEVDDAVDALLGI